MRLDQPGMQFVPKPWGRNDLRPWNEHHDDGPAIGEIWFGDSKADGLDSALLIKILFTTAPLSIQVHPNDAVARSMGQAHGKSEAWFVLAALPDAQVALGLKRRITAVQLRVAIDDGSIAELVRWQRVKSGALIYVPAGTIHAIGAGLVILEIQQRSDTTFRLFDFGRVRPLHGENAIVAAYPGPVETQSPSRTLSAARTLLLANPHFVIERFELAPNSRWVLNAHTETWLFALTGGARAGSHKAKINTAILADETRTAITVGPDGFSGILAYVGSSSIPGLLVERVDA